MPRIYLNFTQCLIFSNLYFFSLLTEKFVNPFPRLKYCINDFILLFGSLGLNTLAAEGFFFTKFQLKNRRNGNFSTSSDLLRLCELCRKRIRPILPISISWRNL